MVSILPCVLERAEAPRHMLTPLRSVDLPGLRPLRLSVREEGPANLSAGFAEASQGELRPDPQVLPLATASVQVGVWCDGVLSRGRFLLGVECLWGGLQPARVVDRAVPQQVVGEP